MVQLRQHQTEGVELIDKAHSQVKNVVGVMPTGAGKTILMAYYAWRCQQRNRGAVLLAHRDVLLEQISDALCLFGVSHSLWCSKSTINYISTNNHKNHGNSYYRETSTIIIASVDTFYRRDITPLLPYIDLWMMDEGHHLVRGNKWFRCIEIMDAQPHIKGLMVTATPKRGDRKGLGRQASGIADELIKIVDMATLIKRGMLAMYKIFVPHSMVDVTDVAITSGGDYNRDQLAAATDKSHITGSVIEHWKKIANGRRTIVFTVNIEHSNHVAEQFRANGVRAVALSSDDSPTIRQREIAKFRAGQTDVLINCDLFSEGFDVPAVEVVVMLRKTRSYGMFKQQFGRCLRVLQGKDYGILIDHVGNTPYMMQTFGLSAPHDDPDWTLQDEQDKRTGVSRTQTIYETITCKECRAYYVPQTAQDKTKCPECGHIHTEQEILDATKEFLEKKGKLIELELNLDLFKEALAQRKQVDESPEQMRNRMRYAGAPSVAYNSAFIKQTKRCNAQIILRTMIQQWCVNWARQSGNPAPPVVQREFEKTFGHHILQAQVMSETDALALAEKIKEDLQ